jgi:hypothetical protein
VGAAVAVGAVVGLALRVVVSVTTNVPLAPEPLSEADQRDFGSAPGRLRLRRP